MIKVVHVGQWHKPDDIRIFQKECRSLAKAGYDVTYYTSDRNGDKVGVSEIDGVSVHIYPYRQKIQNGKGIIKLFQIIYNRVSRPILLYMDVAHSNPDIVHIHEYRISYLVTALKRKNIKVIYDAHEDNIFESYEVDIKRYGHLLTKIKTMIKARKEHQACRNADLVIAATPHIEELLEPYCKKIVTIKNYVIVDRAPSIPNRGGALRVM